MPSALHCKKLDFFARIYRLQSLSALVDTVLEGLADLIPGDNFLCACHDAGTRTISSLVSRYPFSRERFLPEANTTGILGEHPFWRSILDDQNPLKMLSQMESPIRWRENPFFVEVLQADGVQDHLNIEFGLPHNFFSVGVVRSRRGFSMREMRVLLELRAHLPQAVDNARFFDRCGKGEEWAVLPLEIDALRMAERPRLSLRDLPLLNGIHPSMVRRLDDWTLAHWGLLARGVSASHIPPLRLRQGGGVHEFRFLRDWERGAVRIAHRFASEGPSAVCRLSMREREILGHLAQGKRNAEIALCLGLSIHTVRDHIKKIFAKLGVDNRTAAVRHAVAFDPAPALVSLT